MANVTLTNLISKVRKLTARPSSNQITDDSITDYINLYYEYDFPQHLKLFDFKSTYTFVTQPDQDKYTLSQTDRNNYKSFEPPAYCSGFDVLWYQNEDQFYKLWPKYSSVGSIATATGGAGAYTGTLPHYPALKNNVLLYAINSTGTTVYAQDNGAGGFTGNVTAGSINYITGAISVTWDSTIPSGNLIYARYVPYQASRPTAMLFFDDYFILRPVPDAAYEISLVAYVKPTAFSTASPTVRPFLDDYFQLLAYGAALKIFTDSMEMENYQNLYKMYEEQLRLAQRKTIMQIKTQRAATIYSQDLNNSSSRTLPI